MDFHQPKSYMATPYKTPFPYTSEPFYWSGSTVGRRQSNALSNPRKQLQQDTISQPVVYQTLLWEQMWLSRIQRTGSWDTYGLVTFIGPHRQYHVRTARGKMLIRNRRFLRRRVPVSIPTGQRQNEAPQPVQRQSEVTKEPQPVQIQHREPQPVQRKSARQRKPVSRLLEDPSWP